MPRAPQSLPVRGASSIHSAQRFLCRGHWCGRRAQCGRVHDRLEAFRAVGQHRFAVRPVGRLRERREQLARIPVDAVDLGYQLVLLVDLICIKTSA